MTDAAARLTCSCCGRELARAKLHALNSKAYICRRCGLWVALRPRGDRRQSFARVQDDS